MEQDVAFFDEHKTGEVINRYGFPVFYRDRGFAQIVKLRKFASMMEENIRIV